MACISPPRDPSGRGGSHVRVLVAARRADAVRAARRASRAAISLPRRARRRRRERRRLAAQVGEKGYVAGEGVLSMDKLMEVPIRRFKPTSEECPFCRDAPVKENGSKCLGICRNPQNVPGPLVHPHQMQDVEDAVRLQINAMRRITSPETTTACR